LDAEEGSGLALGQHHEQRGEVAADSRDEECRLAPPVLQRLRRRIVWMLATCRASPSSSRSGKK
jgi:hypothetical protein